MALADFVVEHIRDPLAFFAEIGRVVNPGGYVCIRTINVHSYLGLAARLVPNRLHAPTLRRAHPRRRGVDVFATYYRCNAAAPRRGAEPQRIDAVTYASEDEPAYLQFHPLAYRFGLLHRRLAPRGALLGLLGWGRRRCDTPSQRG